MGWGWGVGVGVHVWSVKVCVDGPCVCVRACVRACMCVCVSMCMVCTYVHVWVPSDGCGSVYTTCVVITSFEVAEFKLCSIGLA